MEELFNLFTDLITDIVNFLDSFVIIGNLSILKIFIIVSIFRIVLSFLFKGKKEE